MATVQIPFDYKKGNQIVKADLDGTTYNLKFLWNSRSESWSLEIQQADGTPIVSGVRVVSDYSLLSRYTSVNLPPGRLQCLDSENTGGAPGAKTLGVSFELVYTEA